MLDELHASSYNRNEFSDEGIMTVLYMVSSLHTGPRFRMVHRPSSLQFFLLSRYAATCVALARLYDMSAKRK